MDILAPKIELYTVHVLKSIYGVRGRKLQGQSHGRQFLLKSTYIAKLRVFEKQRMRQGRRMEGSIGHRYSLLCSQKLAY